MAVDFFEKEVKKLQEKFNQTFGRNIVRNLNYRQSALLTICRLGVLARRIMKARLKTESRNYIQEFNRVKDALNNFFDQMERRDSYERSINEGRDAGRRGRGVSVLR